MTTTGSHLVPTLCVGTRVATLCVVCETRSVETAHGYRYGCDAERRQLRSQAERGNESVCILACFLSLLCCASPLSAADDEDDEFISGLVVRYTAGEKTIDRVDGDVQFDWGEHSPDERLPAGPFSATWTGKLLIRAEGKHAFHLFLNGEAAIKLNGKTVVTGHRDTPGWVAGQLVDTDSGEPKIEITYRKTSDQALVRLFWSSEKFPTEPIPPQLFFREAPRRDLDLIARGGALFEAYRCQACHRGQHDEPAEPAPALAKQAVAVSRDWLVDWLVAPQRLFPHARMPDFGFSRVEALAIAELFLAPSEPAAMRLPEGDEGPELIRRGEILFRSIGCLACHTRGDEGSAVIHAGGDLTQIGRKRSAGWLYRWLKEPENLNTDHRMPVFKLADEERRGLALFLSSLQSARTIDQPARSAQATEPSTAQKLIETARCNTCHRIDGAKPNASGVSSLEQPVTDWPKACTEAAFDPRHLRPSYALTADDRRAIRAFVDSRTGSRSPESPFARGARLLQQKGCGNCHERDAGRGIAAIAGAMARLDPALAGQSEALVPPNLSAVGDKLQDEALGLAIEGRQKTTRLPWLRVQMPQFEHKSDDAAALLGFLIGHDRIPAGAPQPESAKKSADAKPNDPGQRANMLKSGQLLAGARGFTCTACHKIGSFEPRNVALATRGSDLYLIGQRMRPEFFMRWTRSPLRVVPGMEMPSFERPVSGILDGNLDRQLSALWEGLNDKSAPPKIDTSTIEQVLTVAAGEAPKIIRDVFNVGDSLSPELIPRAFAVGFDNGVNLLYDLDTMALRGWWTGDFARQRASGKSWFWEPGTDQRLKPAPTAPDVALSKAGIQNAPIITARRESGRFGRLTKYHGGVHGTEKTDVAIVQLSYRLKFPLEEGDIELSVIESVGRIQKRGSPTPAVDRAINISGVPPGYDVVFSDSESDAHAEPHQRIGAKKQRAEATITYRGGKNIVRSADLPTPVIPSSPEPITCVPGYEGVRLPLPMSIMPTAITWMLDGTLAFCSLKGQVYLAKDTDGDGIEDRLILFEEGLAAPYGLIADGRDLIVAHKPELLRLSDIKGDFRISDDRADVREVIADGWGYTEDYHDWTTGIVRDSKGNLYVGTGSDYAKPGRDREKSKWRGKVLRIDKAGHVAPIGHAFRYPTGLAITPDDQIFVSDNQGVQNTFNEINHLVEGATYGVPSLFEENPNAPAALPAIQVPHPWTRSVNGLFFLPRATEGDSHPFAGHGIGCEYDSRFLVRFTVQPVGSTYQGAAYPLSLPTLAGARDGFLGTLCGAVSPNGDIYIGSIYDSGWLGGTNVGDIVRLRPNGKLPVGIREIRAAANQFLILFTAPIDKNVGANRENYEISGYTRKWQGSYATPDSDRHQLAVKSVDVASDGRSVVLHTPPQQTGHVYEIICGKIGPDSQPALWPAVGHYTLNAIPE